MPDPISNYRRAQKELRRHFDLFTQENCPSCPTPCCRKPARIAPSDILLAEAAGWRAKAAAAHAGKGADEDPVGAAASRMAAALIEDNLAAPNEEDAPCDFLGGRGCTFPEDLRPFGCTTFICKYMYARLPSRELAHIRRLVRDLQNRHEELMRAIRRSR